jgi:hypothetical protein
MILEMARQVRGDTLRFLGAAAESELCGALPGISTPIFWYAGYALWVLDALCIQSLAGARELAEGWAETFGQNGPPPHENRSWPARKDEAAALRTQFEMNFSTSPHFA